MVYRYLGYFISQKLIFSFRMLSRPVRQAPRVIARLASSANEATSSANEGAKKSSQEQTQLGWKVLAGGAVVFGVSKLFKGLVFILNHIRPIL